MHRYITCKRFKKKALCGDVNIPALSNLEEHDGTICALNKQGQVVPICFSGSDSAHKFFAINDDNRGLDRFKLSHHIIDFLKNDEDTDPRTDSAYLAKWDKIWGDELCKKYKRVEYADHWLWNNDFYNAPIEDLEYIANLIGA